MATGDNQKTAEAVAAKLGIDEVHAGVLPEDKKALVDSLRQEGARIAMAGALSETGAGLAGEMQEAMQRMRRQDHRRRGHKRNLVILDLARLISAFVFTGQFFQIFVRVPIPKFLPKIDLDFSTDLKHTCRVM